ncbi:Anaphase-promoting complex subunit 5 [Fulvia fulva]|nr:Anaphase-promoting complex subunit 5 [Fulvia fulva]WPV37497.1 Anaphase-promoting complex subunit 5 [Fulvia fulva]
MPRCLTPARVSLLLLVRIYQLGHTSSKSSLNILDFIARHVTLAPDHDLDTINERNALSSPDIGFLAERLSKWTSKYPGRHMYDVFLHTIWELTGLDSLTSLVGSIHIAGTYLEDEGDGVPTTKIITPASPLGQFVRRCQLEFTRLQFADSQALWDAIDAFRAPTYADWAIKNPDTAAERQEMQSHNSVPVAVDRSAKMSDALTSFSAGAVDVDTLLNFSVHQLQKMGTRVPPEVKSKLETWIGDQVESGTKSLHHFMNFFEHWRSGQYTMALESLHRYFDYSLTAKNPGDNLRVYYQYALLHLSVLHADFECWEESVDAMNESIATARENQDTSCLNYALSWLMYLRHAHPNKSSSSFNNISGIVGSGSGEHDEVAFLKQKARDGKHWMLLSSTLLEEAKLEMCTAGSTYRSQEHILQAQHLNNQHDLRTLSPAATMFHGASLDRLGQAHLARYNYELTQTIHLAYCPLNDRVRAVCRLALTQAQSGAYIKASDMLNGLAPSLRGVLKLDQRLKVFTMILQLKRQLHRDNIKAATYYMDQLRPARSSADPEFAFELDQLEIQLLIQQGLFEKALSKVSTQINTLKSRGTDIAQRLHFLLLKAKIFAAGGQAPKGFSIALRATSTAERLLLVPVLLEGLTILSRILIDLSEFEMAQNIIEAALPHALESNDNTLNAKMFVAIGEACVGYAGHHCEAGSVEQTRYMRRAQDLIERGRVAYQKVEDLNGMLDCLLMKEKIAIWDGDETTAGNAEEMYLQLLADKGKEDV